MKDGIEIRKSSKKAYKHLYCPNDVRYEVVNSNGGLLGGSHHLESALEMAQEFIEKYKNDKLNSHLKVWAEELNWK